MREFTRHFALLSHLSIDSNSRLILSPIAGTLLTQARASTGDGEETTACSAT
jgi:hypothetical protein